MEIHLAPPPLLPTPHLLHPAFIFAHEYRLLRPRAPMPPMEVRFYPFTGLNTTIRLREGVLLVRLSDLLEAAPEPVLRAIAHILLAKLYRKPVLPEQAALYRGYTLAEPVRRATERIRQLRGRKRVGSAQGGRWNLDEVFDSLNARFFGGLLRRPVLTWSGQAARRLLGHYDAAHDTIMISRVFDRPATPRCAVEYLMYHEMLHLKHPVTVRAGRRCVHSRAFQEEENRFPEIAAARAWLRKLG